MTVAPRSRHPTTSSGHSTCSPEDADSDGRWRDRLYAQYAFSLYTLFDLERLEETAREWMALALEQDDYGMRVYATVWLILSGVFRKAPGTADLDLIAETLRIDPEQVRTKGTRRLSWRGNWCETDALGLRSILLGTIAFNWDLGYPMEGLGEDLPAETPLGLAEIARGLAAQSIDAEVGDEADWNRLATMIAYPDADALYCEAKRITELGFQFGGAGWIQFTLAKARLGHLDDMPDLGDSLMKLAEDFGDRVIELSAWCSRANNAMLKGRFDDANAAIDHASQCVPDQPALQGVVEALATERLLAMGLPDEARLLAEALDAKSAYNHSHLVGVIGAARGDLETARAVVEEWKSADYPLPVTLSLPGRLWGLAVCAHAIGDAEAARRLYDPVLPYDGQLLLYGMAFLPAGAAYVLGLLAETFGEPDRAVAHFRDALEFEERIGAVPLADQTREALARIG